MPSKKRNYRKEYDNYHARPVQKKRRAARNKSRRVAKKRGMKVKGKDVHHRDHNPSNTSRGNLRSTSKSYNRSRNRPKK
jgi:hypothetical protein